MSSRLWASLLIFFFLLALAVAEDSNPTQSAYIKRVAAFEKWYKGSSLHLLPRSFSVIPSKLFANHSLLFLDRNSFAGKDRNPTVEKIALGHREGSSNVLGNTTMFLTIENIGEGDSIFEAPEDLAITQKVRDEAKASSPSLSAFYCHVSD